MFLQTRKALNALHLSSHFDAVFQVAFKNAGKRTGSRQDVFPGIFPLHVFLQAVFPHAMFASWFGS